VVPASRGYFYGHFDFRSRAGTYHLVAAMHPNDATDHAMLYDREARAGRRSRTAHEYAGVVGMIPDRAWRAWRVLGAAGRGGAPPLHECVTLGREQAESRSLTAESCF